MLAALLLSAARHARAQGPFEGLNLDKLQLVSLGGGVGRILASQVQPAMIYALSADYGEVARNWHVVFGVSYWESRYEDDVVRTFVDSLNKNLSNPSGPNVVPSRISVYDVTFSAEARYTTTNSAAIKPYLGVGFAGHVINAEGKLINGTFVERSLDNIASGLFLSGGAAIKLLRHLGVEAEARADLLSGFRSTQVRAGATYYFGHIRGTQVGSGGDEGKR